MDFRYSRPIKIISAIILFFFIWTFLGLSDIAYAVTHSQGLGVRSSESKKPKAEEKFEDTLEDIEQVLADTDTKKEKLKTKKAEIEAYDIEIRQQFEETEKRIKDAGLPLEILQRHYDFVRKYEENLEELKALLEAIEKAAGKAEVEAEVEKAKEFLKKVKPKKKHVPLDPNKLPHRTAEPTKKKPRTKKEEFEKEFGPQSTQRAQREDSRQYGVGSRQGIKDSRQYEVGSMQEPILVASAGPLSGLLSSDSGLLTQNSELSTPNSQLLTQNLLLAAADPPTDADLAETIEVQFTPAIQAKAAELGNNPVKIYNWVRNNVEFVPTYGSIQGADYCLQTLQCNAFDTASLLIALLRVSGIHARYVYGTIELPIEKVMNWVGGFTDPMAALELIAAGGIPVGSVKEGGKIVKAQLEHVWVEAWIDYIPSRGARHKTGKGDTWVRLDASFKQYNYTEGIDIKSAVPFDAQSFIEQIQSTAIVNEQEGWVTGVDSLYIQQTMEDYQTQVENYINQNYPGATVGDVLGKKEIIQKSFPYLLGTLPYKVVVTGQKTASISDNLRHKIRFKLIRDIYDDFSDTFMDITKSIPELAGKKITLSYSPATPEDEAVINSYLPEPNPDGTPIDPSQLPTSLPAYLINLRPELRVDGEVVATGTVVGLGVDEEFTMTFTAPNKYANKVTNEIPAGAYYGIAVDPVRISEGQMQALKAKLEDTKVKLEAQDYTGLTKDDILGDLLHTTALAYFAEMDAMDYVTAKTMGIENVRLPSLSIFSFELSTTYMFGIPVSVSAGGLAMDIDRDVTASVPLDGDRDKLVQFVLTSGMNGSALEHSVPEQMFSTPENPAEGISAVKAIQIANDQGIPIYTIDRSNIDTILPQLQISSTVKTNIQNAVNAGMVATVPKTNITFNGWTGVGYIIINPATGAGAYMIGGLSGGIIIPEAFIRLIASLIIDEAEAVTPYGDIYDSFVTEDGCTNFHYDEYLKCIVSMVMGNIGKYVTGFLVMIWASGIALVGITVALIAYAMYHRYTCMKSAYHC